MKRMVSLLVALFLLGCGCASASGLGSLSGSIGGVTASTPAPTEAPVSSEPEIPEFTIEPSFTGVWQAFEEYGFQVYLPSDWNWYYLTDEQTASGIFYQCADAGEQLALAFQHLELGKPYTNQEIFETVQATEGASEVNMARVNGHVFVTYEFASANLFGAYVLLDEDTAIQFLFYQYAETLPEALAACVTEITGSFRFLDEAEPEPAPTDAPMGGKKENVLIPDGEPDAETDDGFSAWSNEELGMSLSYPEGVSLDASDPDGFIYLYPDGANIPYVMVGRYPWRDITTFFDEFNKLMVENYADDDLEIGEPRQETLGERTVYVNEYTYAVDGYTVSDARVAYPWGGWTYVFTLKQVESLGHDYLNLLQQVIERFEPIGAER